jgi:predicted ATPase
MTGIELSSLQIQYFRSLYDVSLHLKPLTVVIGPNASGKSNLFKALRFLYDGVAADRQEWLAYDSQADDLNWYGLDDLGERPNTLAFTLSFGQDAGYEVVFRCRDYLEVINEALQVRLEHEQVPLFERQEERVREFIGHRGGRLSQPYRYRARSARTLYLREGGGPSFTLPLAREVYEHVVGWRFFAADPQRARQPSFIPQYPDEVPPLEGDAGNLSAFLYALSRLRPDDHTAIIDTMADFIELPQSLLVEHDAERGGQNARYGFIEQPFGENRLVPPESMSDGTIRLLTLLALLLADHSVSLACLEEPNQGLHPRLMLYLADVLRQAVEAGRQIIITTHSPEFMDCFDLQSEADYLQVYITDRDEGGKTFFTPTSAQEFAPWLEKYRLGEAVRRHFI